MHTGTFGRGCRREVAGQLTLTLRHSTSTALECNERTLQRIHGCRGTDGADCCTTFVLCMGNTTPNMCALHMCRSHLARIQAATGATRFDSIFNTTFY